MFGIAGIRNGWITDFRILGRHKGLPVAGLAKVMRQEKGQAFEFRNPIVKLNIGF